VSLEVAVPARTEDSLVVVAQNAGAGWSAELVAENGTAIPLEPLVVDGWQQGFVVPAGDAGVLTAQFEPDRPYRLGLGLGLLALLGLLAAGLWWRPGRSVRPAPAARPNLPESWGLVGLFAVLFAGLWGLGLAAVAALLVRLAGRRPAGRRRVTAATVLLGVVGAVLLAWFGPDPQGTALADVLPQALLLLTILLALGGAAWWISDGRRPSAPTP